MAPTVILIRHAEGTHNATDWSIHDPPLTSLGVKQCDELSHHLQSHLPLADKIELIVTSPLRRTLQTTDLGLQWLIKRGVPVVPRGEWQENSNMPCDTGSSLDILKHEFPQFNFDTVFPEFPQKTGRWSFSEKAIMQRGTDCRKWLQSRHEKVIAVVTHSAFLRIGIVPTRFANADYRVFDFDGDQLRQWKSTEENGGGLGRSPKGTPVILTKDFEIPDYMKEKQTKAVDGEATKELPK